MGYENEFHSKNSHGQQKAKVDIDETICHYPSFDVVTTGRRYQDAQPDFHAIARINKLYNEGWIIVYATSRGSSNPADKNRITWLRQLTTDQLQKWGCKYHQLIMGDENPLYDLVIDDKAKRMEEL